MKYIKIYKTIRTHILHLKNLFLKGTQNANLYMYLVLISNNNIKKS